MIDGGGLQYSRDLKGAHRPLLLFALSLLACGAVALPLLPIWQGGIRVLAGIVLLISLGSTSGRRLLGLMLGGLLLSSAVAWLQALMLSPARHVIRALTDVYGLALGIVPDGLLLLYDLICIVGLTILIIGAHWRNDRMLALFAVTAAMFWLWSLLTPLFYAATGTDSMRIAQMMTGLSGWATWVYWALLPLLLARDETDVRKLLTGIGIAGLFVGSVIGLQWALHDFSYVLDSQDLKAYFYRARGTDYYHAAASFTVILTAMTLLALRRQDGKPAWILPAVVLLLAVAVLNGTRALNLALLIGLGIVLVGMMRQRRWRLAVVALAGMAALSTNILYVKPGSEVSANSSITNSSIRSATAACLGKPSQETNKFRQGEPQTHKPQTDKPQTDKPQTDKPQADKPQTHKPQTDKPQTDKPQADKPQTDKPQTDKPTVSDVIAANSSRSQLVQVGLALLPSATLVGEGIGTLKIPLEGNTFNGMRSTYSTHILYFDIALMAGFPALFLTLTFFGMAIWRAGEGAFVRAHSGRACRDLAFLSFLLVFAVASLFLPQERNELIGIAFLLAAVAMLQFTSGRIPTPISHAKSFWHSTGFMLIGTVVAGWAVLTSPTYIFPAIEFAAKYGSEVAQKDERVMVTEPAMKPVLEVLLRLRGVKHPRVSVLEDDACHLSVSGAWILWNPVRDVDYPLIRQHQGYQKFRQGGHAPSIVLPPHWWIVSSVQPTVIFLYGGDRSGITLPLHELASVTPFSGVSLLSVEGDQDNWSYLSIGGKAVWRIGLREGLPKSIWLEVEVKRPGQTSGKLELNKLIDLSGSNEIEVSLSGIPKGALLRLDARMPTLPNQAHLADIAVSENVSMVSPNAIADLNYGTVASWPLRQDAIFQFATRTHLNYPLRIYRVVALGHRSMPSARRYDWVIEGSQDGLGWQKLDSRKGQVLSRNPALPSAFYLPENIGFPYYRFRFRAIDEEYAEYGGIAEIEIYTHTVGGLRK